MPALDETKICKRMRIRHDKKLAELILKEFHSSEQGIYRRNQIRALDLFVAACRYHLPPMSNNKLSHIVNINFPENRCYSADNIFQSRKRHESLIDETNPKTYNNIYHKIYKRIVLTKSPGEDFQHILIPRDITVVMPS